MRDNADTHPMTNPRYPESASLFSEEVTWTACTNNDEKRTPSHKATKLFLAVLCGFVPLCASIFTSGTMPTAPKTMKMVRDADSG